MGQDELDTTNADNEEEWQKEMNADYFKGLMRKKMPRFLEQYSKKKGEDSESDDQEQDEEEQTVEIDEDFEEEEIELGDQFMACKPWLGSIKKPTVGPLIEDASPPSDSYEIDFVYGYKSNLARQNLFYNQDMHLVYMTAALGIILDPVERRQKVFGGGEEKVQQRKQQSKGEYGHSDDIVALAWNTDRSIVATG